MLKEKRNFAFKTFFMMVSILTFGFCFSYSKDIVISRDFVLFTSKNLEGYIKPIFTTLEQSLNTTLFGTSLPDGKFRFTLNLSVSGMIIPDAQKTFDAEVPDGFFNDSVTQVAQMRNGEVRRSVVKPNIQPTIYGGSSTPIFSAPQSHTYPDSIYKTIAYPEGLHIDFMAGLPVLQAIVETPLKNEIRFRFFSLPIQDETFVYLTIGLNQRVDDWFNLFGFDKNKAISVHFALHRMYYGNSFDLTSYAIGINAMQRWGNTLIGYVGLQYEDFGGKFRAVKDTTGLKENVINSPFPELRQAKPIEISFNSYTKFQAKGGFTLTFYIGFLNFELSYASQPMISLGFGLFIGTKKNEN